MFNSASSQLMKFAQNRGDEINNLDRLLQMQMGLPQNAPAPLPQQGANGLPYGQATPNQLVTPEPIRPATFQRPQEIMAPAIEKLFGQEEQPQVPEAGATPPFVDPTAPQGLQQPPPQHGPTIGYGGSPPVYEPHWPQQPQMEPNRDKPPVAPLGSRGVNMEFAMGPSRPNRPNDDVLSVVEAAAASVLGPGSRAVITSGTEGDKPQYGSPRHKTGRAADVAFYDPDGKKIGSADPRMAGIARAAAQNGALGIGFGKEYMGGDHMHIDLVDPSEVGGAHTWGSGAKQLSKDLFGSAAPTGATGRGGQGGAAPQQTSFDRGPTVAMPEQAAPMSEAEYEQRLATLEEMAQNATPQRMTNREQFSRENFDLGGALRGFGLGLGQMSRGQAVDLGDVYNAQERRAGVELELQLDRNRRTAASQMALEMGDPESAAAIAQGGIDFGQFLTSRQMEQVEARAMRNEMRDEIGRNAIFDYLAPQLGEEAARAAMYNPSSVLGFEQIMEANRRAEVARQEQAQTYQQQLDLARRALENPNASPTEQWAGQYVAASGGTTSFEDALKMAGDEYDRYAPPEPPAPTTDMRNFEAAMADLPPEQRVPFGTWLDRGGSSTSATEQKISRLMEADPTMTREQAINTVDRYGLDPAGGGLVDLATGAPIRPAFAPATGYAPEVTLWDQAGTATGVGATAARGAANVIGQIPFGIGSAIMGDDNPFITSNRAFEAAKEDLGRALAMNPRFPVGEMDRIINSLALQTGVTVAPGALRAHMRGADTYMRRRLDREMQVANDPTATDDERAAARSAAQGIATFIETMGVPVGDTGPVHLPSDPTMQKQIVEELPEGALFKLPGEDNYRRKVTKQ